MLSNVFRLVSTILFKLSIYCAFYLLLFHNLPAYYWANDFSLFFFPLTGLEVYLFIYFFGPILLLAFNSFCLIQFLP